MNEDTKHNIWDIFNTLSQPWTVGLPDNHCKAIRKTIERFYEPQLLTYFDTIVNYQRYRKEHLDYLDSQEFIRKQYARYKKCEILSKLTIGKIRQQYKKERDFLAKYIQKRSKNE